MASRMESVLKIAKALADRQRLRILMLLGRSELCVCQIIAVFDLAPSTISKHLAILSAAGLISHRKEGRWAYYRLRRDAHEPAIRSALSWLNASLRGDVEIERDSVRIARILKHDPAILCRQQKDR